MGRPRGVAQVSEYTLDCGKTFKVGEWYNLYPRLQIYIKELYADGSVVWQKNGGERLYGNMRLTWRCRDFENAVHMPERSTPLWKILNEN